MRLGKSLVVVETSSGKYFLKVSKSFISKRDFFVVLG